MRRCLIFLLSFFLASTSHAGPIPFDGTWKEQGFLSLFTNEYALRGSRLDVVSDGTVSIIWRPVDTSLNAASQASWNWQVSQSVGATDLSKKGGDDRNLSMYFVFVDPDLVATLKTSSARKVLRHPSTRALVYVWGGQRARGTVISSPYSSQLRTVILRPAATGGFSENVNLSRDYARAFGDRPKALVAVAVSADSDDTDGLIRAQIANLSVK